MTSRVVVLRMDLAYRKRSFDVSRVIDFPGKKKGRRGRTLSISSPVNGV